MRQPGHAALIVNRPGEVLWPARRVKALQRRPTACSLVAGTDLVAIEPDDR
jgi:hypothetical protein